MTLTYDPAIYVQSTVQVAMQRDAKTGWVRSMDPLWRWEVTNDPSNPVSGEQLNDFVVD